MTSELTILDACQQMKSSILELAGYVNAASYIVEPENQKLIDGFQAATAIVEEVETHVDFEIIRKRGAGS